MESNDMAWEKLTEEELQRLIEQWRKGDREAAEQVCLYVWFRYFQEVARRLAQILPEVSQDGAKAVEHNDRDEPSDDAVENENEDLEGGEVHECVEHDHDEHTNHEAMGLNRRVLIFYQSNNQLHDFLKEGSLRWPEIFDLMLEGLVKVTKNTPKAHEPSSGKDTYTGNYSKRDKLGKRSDFKWAGKREFGNLVTKMWLNECIESLRDYTDQPSRTPDPGLIEGDISDAQQLQEAVYSGIRPIDLFLRAQLDVICKEGELLSETVLRAVLNRLIEGEPLWSKPEIGFVDFGTGFKPKTKASQRRANRDVLVKAYKGLILDVKERVAGPKRVPPVQVQELTEEDAPAISEHTTSGDHQIQPRDQLTMREAEACVLMSRELLRELFRLSELKEPLPEGSARRLVEGIIIFRKQLLWNTNSVHPILVWTVGAAVTEEERTLLDEIRRTPIEQLIEEADLSIFLDDPCGDRQPLYVQATKFILRYNIPDVPRDGSEKEMGKLVNTYVYQPKRRLRPKLECIVPWFYRDKEGGL